MVLPTEAKTTPRASHGQDSETELVTQPFGTLWNLEAIFHLPAKVVLSPTAEAEITGQREGSDASFWQRFKFHRHLQVSLDDILDSRCLPPIGLKDLEYYLSFEERHVENLYFVLWFQDYRKHYITWDQSSASKEPGPDRPLASTALVRSFNLAVETFFSSTSAFQLTLNEDLRRSVLRLQLAPNPNTPILTQVDAEIRNQLNASLDRFLAKSHWNMGRAYMLLGYVLGVCLVVISLIPLLATLRYEYPIRLIRLVGIVPLFIGFYILDTSRLGVCPIIYGLSDMRQIRPWEQRTSIPSSRAASLNLTRTISVASITSRQFVDNESQNPPSSTYHNTKPLELTDRNARPERISAGFIPSFYYPRSEASSSPTPSGPSSRSFDFSELPNVIFRKSKEGYSERTIPESDDDLESQCPPRITTASFPPVPCFARLTEVHSPIVRRLQWEIVVKSMAVQIVLACGVTAGLMMVHVQ